jgi:hypothetical protein
MKKKTPEILTFGGVYILVRKRDIEHSKNVSMAF